MIDVIKLATFSFGIEPKEADQYELVSSQGDESIGNLFIYFYSFQIKLIK